MAPKIVPLSTTFFLTSLIGFLVSIFYISTYSLTWAFAFALLFFIMLIASIISMFRARAKKQLK